MLKDQSWSRCDLTSDVSDLADCDEVFKQPAGGGYELAHGTPGSPDSSERAVMKVHEIYVPDLRIDTLEVKSRNFH